MKYLLVLILALGLFSCEDNNVNNNDYLKSGTEHSAEVIDLGRYPGGHIYKVKVDSSVYIMVNDIKGVAITKHK